MLPLPDRRSPKSHPTPNTYHVCTPPTVPLMDTTAADFRAFYPYTPNEVKHRKRTTNAQLKTLESVFKRDTKPNGPLRVDLATQLGMTARGVQVWFQNRRAKEKLKATKARKIGATNSNVPKPSSEEEPTSVSPTSAHPSPPFSDACGTLDSPSQASSPASASPSVPHIQVVQDQSPPAWATPADIHSLSHRRGSLPANAFPHYEFSTNSPPDAFDPLTRRLSVDASLQRLANNPYAHLARAKNTALYGPRAMAPMRRPLGRPGHYSRRASPSIPYPLDIRRASVGAFRISPQSTVSSSPSPLSNHSAFRASLPDNQLYAVPSRNLPSPLPGPLPSPNFSFGAANTPSMVSTSSGGSEGNSPDSLRAFPYREPEQDDEDGNFPSASYYPSSRFGSIASVATSDSSLNSSCYPEAVQHFADAEYALSVRRDSCVSGPFASLMSNLDVSGTQDSMMNPQEHEKCALQEDFSACGVIRVNSNDVCAQTGSYPSPTSAISPEIPGGHHPMNNRTSPIPISRSSELANALQSHSDQVNSTSLKHISLASPSIVPRVIEPDIIQSINQYPFSQGNGQEVAPAQAVVSSADFDCRYQYDHGYSGSYLPEDYSTGPGSQLNSLNQTFSAADLPYRSTMGSVEYMTHNVYATYT